MKETSRWPSMKVLLIAVIILNVVNIGLSEIQRRALVRDVVGLGLSEVQRQVLVQGIRDVIADLRETDKKILAAEQEDNYRNYKLLDQIATRMIKIEALVQNSQQTADKVQEIEKQLKASRPAPDAR